MQAFFEVWAICTIIVFASTIRMIQLDGKEKIGFRDVFTIAVMSLVGPIALGIIITDILRAANKK